MEQSTKQAAPSGRQPGGHNPSANLPGVQSEEKRSDDYLPDRELARNSAVSVPGGDRGAGINQSDPKPTLTNSPLAQMHRLIERAGEEAFPDDIIRTLSERIDDRIVDIRPDGLIFVSHPHYRDRLDSAFGVGGWALVPLATPQIRDNRVVYYGFLKARGQYIGDAVGGSQYYPNNNQGSYDNSVEAAKSDCLVRCCKALPMFRECWDKEYADYWVANYAEKGVTRQSNGKVVWKKKGEAMRDFTMRPDRQSVGEYYRAPRVQDEQQAHIDAIATEGTLRLAARDEKVENPEYQWDREEDN